MKPIYRAALLFAVVALACAPATVAQPDKPWKAWFPHIAAQYTMPQGDAGDALDDGWGLAGGVTYKPDGWKIGIPIELGYTSNDMKSSFVDTVLPGDDPSDPPASSQGARGDVEFWHLTGGVMWQTDTAGSVDFYLDANVGAYYTQAETRVPAGYAWAPGFCGWYWCYPGQPVAVDAVRSESQWDFGGNVGVGVAFALANESQIYIEVKYQYVDAGDGIEWVPIQVGYRW